MIDIKVGSKIIGSNHAPFVIAEMSANHMQSLEHALKIVEEAARAGVHALKLQTYTADTMTLNVNDGDFFIGDKNSLWYGKSLYELYEKASTPWEWHKPIFDRCKELGMIGFSTPFDETAVDFLETLDVSLYKIASFENVDLKLIKKAAATKKPLIISTGMASVSEIESAVNAARSAGCKDLVLLKCTSSYPATVNDSHLMTIPHMRTLFNCQVGLSDHTLGIGAAVASVALGATVIEKHLTLSRADDSFDAAFSLEPHEMRMLVTETEQARKALGFVHYGPTDAEKASLMFRRSLYISKDVRTGDVLDHSNVRAIRPGYGLAPKEMDLVFGRVVTKDLKKGTPVRWEVLK